MGRNSPHTTPSNSQTPFGCQRIQLSSDTAYLQYHQIPQVKDSVLQVGPPPTSEASRKPQVVPCASGRLATD